MNRYAKGQGVIVDVTFSKLVNGVVTPTDPTTVALSIRDPHGAVTTPTPVHGSTGYYSYEFVPSLVGLYSYHYVGTGAVDAAYESVFVVGTTAF